LTREVVNRLTQLLPSTERVISKAQLRQSLVQALAQIAHPSSVTTLATLTSGNREAPAIRQAALRGLQAIGDPGTADVIVSALNDPVAGVRLSAVRALRTTATFAHAKNLRDRLSPRVESDADVRDEAWNVLSDLLEKATVSDLNIYAESFKEGPDDGKRRLRVLTVLEGKLEESARQDPQYERQLAACRENRAQMLLKLNTNFDEAAEELTKALAYYKRIGAPAATLNTPMQLRMEALIRAKKFSDAADFATVAINDDPGLRPVIWLKIRDGARVLMEGRDFSSAVDLLAQMKRVPLGKVYEAQLLALEAEVRRQGSTGGRVWVRHFNRFEHAAISPFPIA
jgi:hypothetical protein